MKFLDCLILWQAKLKLIQKSVHNQAGAISMGILVTLIGVVITLIVLAYAIPELWPVLTTASENITSMSGTDTGTSMIQAFWPIILMVVGLGLAAGLIVYALKKFNVMT